MLRTTHIRTKLGVALSVPLLALVAVAGFEVVSAATAVRDTSAQTQLAAASVGPGSLVTRLQDERNRASIDLIGLGAAAGLPVDTNEEARRLVDDAARDLRDRLAGRDAVAVAAFAPAWKALDALDQLRADIDAYTGPMDVSNQEMAAGVFDRYTTIIDTFFQATSTVAPTVDDASLRNGIDIVDAAARQSEVRARVVRQIVLAQLTGTAGSTEVVREVATLADRGAQLDDEIRTNAVGPYAGVAAATFAEPGVQSFTAQVDAFLAGRPVAVADLLGALRSEPDTGYLGLRTRAVSVLAQEAGRIEGDALAHQKLFGGLAMAMLLAAALVTRVASRSITTPLASLQLQAEEMAGTRLPAAVRQILETPAGEDVVIPEIEPIRVSSRDEVAEVAAALSAVQTSALDLAVEQAVLRRNISDSYINLGRRNQNLLSRQLDFITELERNESDPDTLEGLFRLDHLATRMRRNAESLLVLAGIEAPRQWSAPVKMSDVVRAALGEVEDYQRVVIRHLEPASLTGAVAADIAHVTAELIENALSFSPQDQQVEVKGRLTTSGYTLAISDNGFGMSAEEIERANRRLAGAESFTVAPSRYLGHYVAGHLASRLGVVVELHDSPAGGITARVDVPMGLLANDETDPRLAALSASPPAEAPTSATPEPAPARPEAERPSATVADSPSQSAATPPSFTLSGLPRRGERPAGGDSLDLDLDSPPPSGAPRQPAAPAGSGDVDGDRSPAPTVATDEPRSRPDPDAAEEVDDIAPGTPPPSPTRGFGGLAVTRPQGPSLFTVAAQNARNGTSTAPAGPATTPTGLTRRVPGAQRPDAGLGGRAEPAQPPAVPAPASTEPARSTPEDVYSFLSSFQSGVARGRADVHNADVDSVEDER